MYAVVTYLRQPKTLNRIPKLLAIEGQGTLMLKALPVPGRDAGRDSGPFWCQIGYRFGPYYNYSIMGPQPYSNY